MKTGHLEQAIDILMGKVYEDAKKGKAEIKTAETLESLIRSWANLQTVAHANSIAESIQGITGKSPELPFEFPKARKLEAL